MELTDLLRTDPSLEALRSALRGQGVDETTALLAGLIDGEDETSYGAIVLTDRSVWVFEQASDNKLTRWEVAPDPALLLTDFEAVVVALELA